MNLSVGQKSYTIPARYGLPEVALDPELTTALRRGRNVSITIQSEEGNIYRNDSHPVGFTAAHNYVLGPL